MATSALLIEWGMPIPGREARALEEFSVTMRWWEDLASTGRIGEFRVVGVRGGDYAARSGFCLLSGTDAQIDAVLASPEFRARLNRALATTQHVCVHRCECGERMARRMQAYGAALKQVGL